MINEGLFPEWELNQLAQQIKHHENAYRNGVPEIPDGAFDVLVDEYKQAADELGLPPERRIDFVPWADHTPGFTQVEHRVPMLSLEKISQSDGSDGNNRTPLIEQLASWYDRRKRDLGIALNEPLPLVVEPKIDGISVSLLYIGGRLDRAVTRGGGTKGDDITEQVRTAGAVPLCLRGSDGALVGGSLEARGELYWPIDAFMAHNDRLANTGADRYANPRNGCAGLMKSLRPSGFMKLKHAGIRSFLYQVPWFENITLPSRQSEVLRWLKDHGADVYLDEVFLASDANQAFAFCRQYVERRHQLAFEIDGMVIKLDELDRYDRLEGTGHHPHWAIAYKFAPERKPTVVKSITVQVGKSGKLTPVAELEPVLISGSTVSRASLHNFPELMRKDVRIGDTVFVEKAGEIIPQVVGVDRDKRPDGTLRYVPPKQCPTCQSEVLSDDIFVYCPNSSCPGKVREELRHFSSRTAMDIEGLGSSLIEQLISQHGVTSPDALFRLQIKDMETLDRKGAAAKVISALEAAKGRGLARVLAGLAIRHVGTAMAEDIANYFGTADALIAFAQRYTDGDRDAIDAVAPEDGSGAIEGMARKTADNVFAELASPRMRKIFKGLGEAGVKLEAARQETQANTEEADEPMVIAENPPIREFDTANVLTEAADVTVADSVSESTDVATDNTADKKPLQPRDLGVQVLNKGRQLVLDW